VTSGGNFTDPRVTTSNTFNGVVSIGFGIQVVGVVGNWGLGIEA
jgi:hypothetical protein